MSDIKLFQISPEGARELTSHFVAAENELRLLIEKNMETLLGVRFLAREHSTGRQQRGFIDSLGLDENDCPVIVEYKRRANENVITQGLYYLDWLLDHEGDFTRLVAEKLNAESAENVDFEGARVLCVASDFNRFDERALAHIDRSVELLRYRFFGDDLLMLERVAFAAPMLETRVDSRQENSSAGMPSALRVRLSHMTADTESLYLETLSFAQSLGEDVTIKFLKHYVAMSRLKNFVCVGPQKTGLKLWLNLNPDEVLLEEGFSRDVREIGHHASGNLEVDLRDFNDLERAKPLIELAYAQN